MADGGLCDGLPGPARLACQVPDSVAGAVTGAVGSAASGVFDQAAQAVTASATFFLTQVGALLEATTTVDVSAPWFLRQYAVMFGLSAGLTLALLLLAVLKEVVRGDWAAALRSASVHYLMAVFCSAFAPAVVYLLLRVSDGLCAALMTGNSGDTQRFLDGLGSALTGLAVANGPQAGPFTLLVAALLAIACALVLWVELLLRTAIIYVSLLFAAPTFSGLVDRRLWRHSRRWVSFVVSVVFAKPVVVAVLLLAAAGAGNAGSADGFSSVFTGLALMLIAIFSVGLLFRLVPNAGDQIAGALTARRELRAATPSVPLPSPSVLVKQSVQSHLLQATRRTPATPAGAGPAAALAAHRTKRPQTRGERP